MSSTSIDAGRINGSLEGHVGFLRGAFCTAQWDYGAVKRSQFGAKCARGQLGASNARTGPSVLNHNFVAFYALAGRLYAQKR